METLVIYLVEKSEDSDSPTRVQSASSPSLIDKSNKDREDNEDDDVHTSRSWGDLERERIDAFHAQGDNVQRGLEYNGKLYDIARSVRRCDQPPTWWISESEPLRNTETKLSPTIDQTCTSKQQQQQPRQQQQQQPRQQQQQQQKMSEQPKSQKVPLARQAISKTEPTRRRRPGPKSKRPHRVQNHSDDEQASKEPRSASLLHASTARNQEKVRAEKAKTTSGDEPRSAKIKCRHCGVKHHTRAERRRHEMTVHGGRFPVLPVLLAERTAPKNDSDDSGPIFSRHQIHVNEKKPLKISEANGCTVQQAEPSASNGQVVCRECSVIFAWEPSLLKHMEIAHSNKDENATNDSPII